MGTEKDAVATGDDEHVCVFVLRRTSAGLSEASIYPTSSHFVEYVPIHGSVDIDIMIHTSFRFEHGWLLNRFVFGHYYYYMDVFLSFPPVLAYNFRDGINKAQQRLTTTSQLELDANRWPVFYGCLQCVLRL